MDFEQARFNMVEQQIRPWEVFDAEALAALLSVKRERFVPEALSAQAFTDTELPIGKGQRMFEPKVEARVLQALAIRPGDKVLEVGAGSGHMAALIASRAEWVWTVEIESELAALAQRNLKAAGVDNVTVEHGDGLSGWPERAPYGAILLSGGLKEVPTVLFDQLKVGGRLFAFVGASPVMQATLYTKTGDGQIRKSVVFDTLLPELRQLAHSGFSF